MNMYVNYMYMYMYYVYGRPRGAIFVAITTVTCTRAHDAYAQAS